MVGSLLMPALKVVVVRRSLSSLREKQTNRENPLYFRMSCLTNFFPQNVSGRVALLRERLQQQMKNELLILNNITPH